jgi:calcineurin-like phosphoesterase family protein
MRHNLNDGNLWFFSDPHFGHKNIIKGLSNWDSDGLREFDSVQDMDATIIDNINKYVGINDTLICNGDFAFGDKRRIPELIEAINCTNLHLIYGNHDHRIRQNYADLFKSTREFAELTVIESQPKAENGKQPKAKKHRLVLCHYPVLVWNGHMKGWIHLHGHCHDSMFHTNPQYYDRKVLDVGIDSAFRIFGEYRPFSFQEVLDLTKDKALIALDHHNENTNV